MRELNRAGLRPPVTPRTDLGSENPEQEAGRCGVVIWLASPNRSQCSQRRRRSVPGFGGHPRGWGARVVHPKLAGIINQSGEPKKEEIRVANAAGNIFSAEPKNDTNQERQFAYLTSQYFKDF